MVLLSLNNDLCKSEAAGSVEVVPVAALDVPACGCGFGGEVFADEVLGDCLTGD